MTQHDIAMQFGQKLCEAWGLNAAEVLSIQFTIEPHELPVAEIHVLLNEQVVRHVLSLIPADGPLPD